MKMKMDIYKCPILKYRVENILGFSVKCGLHHYDVIKKYNILICYCKMFY